jgi:hypothetical protein
VPVPKPASSAQAPCHRFALTPATSSGWRVGRKGNEIFSGTKTEIVMPQKKRSGKMKTTIRGILILAMGLLATNSSHAGIRCNNDLISLGDTSSEVVLKLDLCGKVLGKEVVSRETTMDTYNKKTGNKVKKEKIIEIWYIQVNERGGKYCYPLSFEEGRLQNIGHWSRCD